MGAFKHPQTHMYDIAAALKEDMLPALITLKVVHGHLAQQLLVSYDC